MKAVYYITGPLLSKQSHHIPSISDQRVLLTPHSWQRLILDYNAWGLFLIPLQIQKRSDRMGRGSWCPVKTARLNLKTYPICFGLPATYIFSRNIYMKRNLKSAVSDSTVSPGWQNVASSSSNSNCCFEVVEPGLNSAPPEGGFVDLNATCSHDSRTLGTGVLACDMPAAPLAMANRTLFIRSSGGSVLGRGVSDVVRGVGAMSGQSTTRHCQLLLLLFSYCCSYWTHSHKLRILWLVMIDLWFVIQSHFTIDFIWSTIQAKDYKPEHFWPMGMFLAITQKTRQKSKKKSNCIRDLLHIENNERFAHNEMKMYFWTSRECSVFFSSFKSPDIAWSVFGCHRPSGTNWTRGVLRFP